jgi:short-subunit dehydrogenase
MDLSGKIALVTGASAGIGLATSQRLAAAGAKVAMLARTQDRLERAAASVPGAVPIAADVTDLGRMARLPREIADRLGGLDILVNNAGALDRGPILRQSPEALLEVITTNLSATIYLTRAAAEVIRPGGAVVMIASLAGVLPIVDQATYCASKAGLRAFSRAIVEEMADRGILVTTVSPGPVDTDFFGDLDQVSDLFFSQPMLSSDEVAAAVMDALETRRQEIALPALSGKLATLCYLFPRLEKLLRPALLRRGRRNKRIYMETRKPY